MGPFEDGYTAGEDFVCFFESQFRGGTAAGLNFRTDIQRSRLGESRHGNAVKIASVLIAKKEMAGVRAVDDDGCGSVFDHGAEAGFAGAHLRGAVVDAAFESQGEITEFAFSFFAFADVSGNYDVNIFSAHENGSGGNFNRNVSSIETTNNPLEAMGFFIFDESDDFGGFWRRLSRKVGAEERVARGEFEEVAPWIRRR